MNDQKDTSEKVEMKGENVSPELSVVVPADIESTNISPKTNTNVPKEEKIKKTLPKKLIAVLFFVVLLIVSVGLAYYFVYINRSESAEESLEIAQIEEKKVFVASVGYVEGNVWKIVDERKIEILEGDVLEEGDKIQTDEASRVVLFIDDGSVIRLDENAVTVLSSLLPARLVIDQEEGEIFARVEKSESHEFIVVARGIEVHSLGTAFSVDVDDEVSVNVFESKVKVVEEGKEEIEVSESNSWKKETGLKVLSEKDVKENDFWEWSLKEGNLKKEITSTPSPVKSEPTATPETISTSGIILSGVSTDSGIKLTWSVNGVNVDKGMKIVRNTSGNPVYPGDKATYVDKATRSYTLNHQEGKTWRIRVCAYTGKGCSDYSNEISVKAPSDIVSTVKSINVSASYVGDGKVEVSWSVDGYSPKGYKVVSSKNSGATYPPRDGDSATYVSNPDTKSAKIKSIAAGWTYYIRVCEYTGGGCGIYSNEVTVSY